METSTIPHKEVLLDNLSGQPSALEGAFPESVEKARWKLSQQDFPTTRDENWKYTRTSRLAREAWKAAPAIVSESELKGLLTDGWDTHLLVFVNGFLDQQLSSSSLPKGLSVLPLAEAADFPRHNEESVMDFFASLHEVHCSDGVLICAEKSSSIDKPVHVLFLQQGEGIISQPHLLIQTRQSSTLEVLITFASLDGGKAFCNAVIEGHAAANSSLTCTLLQQESNSNMLISRSLFSADQDARLTVNTISAKGGWIRNDLQVKLNGTGIEAFLNGIYVPRNGQHIDNHTLVDHRHPHCESNELYKGVMGEAGRAVFNGKVYVRQDAQKTNAYQNNANIMMSDDASVYTKPELEIYADDVKCSHGSTTGQLDEQAVFYLRARGIGEDNARRLLTTAFIHEVIDRISSEPLRNHIINLFRKENLLLD